MRLVFLGTGGYRPNERRHTASVMLPDVGVVFDAGTSFFRMPDYLKTRDLQLFLTHPHLDHICGLTYCIVPLMKDQLDSMAVFGTLRTLAGVNKHVFSDETFPVALPKTEYLELPEQVEVARGGTLTYCELQHPGGSVGYRIDWPDASLAYITDTTAPGDYGSFIEGVDLLIHECYFPDDMSNWAYKTGHSCTTPVAELAKTAGVSQLALVHIDPERPEDDPIGLETAQAIFPNTFLAEDKMEIEFGA